MITADSQLNTNIQAISDIKRQDAGYSESRIIKRSHPLVDENPFMNLIDRDKSVGVQGTSNQIKLEEGDQPPPTQNDLEPDSKKESPDSYSGEYMRNVTKNTALEIRDKFAEWASADEDFKLEPISRAKKIIDKNIDLLEHDSGSRIFIGTLELIFSNNEWENFESKKIKAVADALTRYATSSMSSADLNTFRNRIMGEGLNIIG